MFTRIRRSQIESVRSFFNFAAKSQSQTYQISKILNGPPSQLFQIVSQVDNYKLFVPFVEDSYILSRDSQGFPSNAGLKVGWKDITEKFDCELDCIENVKVSAKSIELELFEFLETEWIFRNVEGSSNEDQCKIDFKLNYKFKNPIYDKLSFMFAPQVTEIMIGAFEKRLKQMKRDEMMSKFKNRQAKL
ncbi:unnamed protein product [Candida verbasci]|uniref:Coenzyme Q-binding protein COQ10 START domain-containing protein n=1 Tax=Candida verbasci TaxID=1227364 RepID=A0A9W4XN09_9ASCO|nr:unnamed protein product [Candida verbasci]